MLFRTWQLGIKNNPFFSVFVYEKQVKSELLNFLAPLEFDKDLRWRKVRNSCDGQILLFQKHYLHDIRKRQHQDN